MGVLDTTYTFTATDVVTSAKLNNVIDQATFTSSAIATGNTTLAVTASGQLKVNTSGIGANELADDSVNTAKILNANVTQAKIGTNVVGTGPVISAQSLTSTSVPTGNNTYTKILLDQEIVDTNDNFANSKFTPTVAGYYQVNFGVSNGNGALALTAFLFKNSSIASSGTVVAGQTYVSRGSVIVALNGTNDFIEVYAQHIQGSTMNISGNMIACLIRSL
jgi:hypothetical protein